MSPGVKLGFVDAIKQFEVERRSLAHAREAVEILPLVTRRCSINGLWNSVESFGLTSDNADEEILAQINHFRTLGRSFEWKVYRTDMPGDLVDRLSKHGFEIGEREAWVVYDLPHGDSLPDSNCRVERILRQEQIKSFREVAESVFGKDYGPTCGELLAALKAGDPGHLGFVGFAGSAPVSVGRLYTDPNSRFGGLYGGGTLSKYRGQGFYRALVAERARVAKNLGAKYLLVDALPTSLPILLRLGFVHLNDSWPCTWTP